jgi:hypothetical protein
VNGSAHQSAGAVGRAGRVADIWWSRVAPASRLGLDETARPFLRRLRICTATPAVPFRDTERCPRAFLFSRASRPPATACGRGFNPSRRGPLFLGFGHGRLRPYRCGPRLLAAPRYRRRLGVELIRVVNLSAAIASVSVRFKPPSLPTSLSMKAPVEKSYSLRRAATLAPR